MSKIAHTFLSDPGHGWLIVTLDTIKVLGIEHAISTYSYIDKGIVYLEEDCDAQLYIAAYKEQIGEITIQEKFLNGDAPCRGFCPYSVEAANGVVHSIY